MQLNKPRKKLDINVAPVQASNLKLNLAAYK